MKLYDYAPAPNPRRARFFIAEKGLEVDTVQVDLRQKQQFDADFKALNPRCTVPALVLDDGTAISENQGIAAYLEALHPEPPLLGRDAAEKGRVAMWNARMEREGMDAISEAYRNHSERFAGRAIPGPEEHAQIPELARRGKRRAEAFLRMLDERLARHAFLCGDHFTVADITAVVAVDFAAWIKLSIAAEQTHLRRWYDAVSARPAAKA